MKVFLLILILLFTNITGGQKMGKIVNEKLTDFQKSVIFNKNTERPFSGEYNDFYKDGIYTCANCGSGLYTSTDKFKSSCGWPSFDDEIVGAVKKVPDADGYRTEIVCAKCGGHLGHVFTGEGLTAKNVRHCVNSASMNFVNNKDLGKAYFGGGCFWGVEYFLEEIDGVLSVESGYMGGHVKNPSYRDVCTGKTGHREIVEVLYDSTKVNYKTLAKRFFEIHDPTQVNGQGPDIGEQYLSYVFYNNDEEKEITEQLIDTLEKNGYMVATKLEHSKEFWPAEDYHQNYYSVHKKVPYCHAPVNRFK